MRAARSSAAATIPRGLRPKTIQSRCIRFVIRRAVRHTADSWLPNSIWEAKRLMYSEGSIGFIFSLFRKGDMTIPQDVVHLHVHRAQTPPTDQDGARHKHVCLQKISKINQHCGHLVHSTRHIQACGADVSSFTALSKVLSYGQIEDIACIADQVLQVQSSSNLRYLFPAI